MSYTSFESNGSSPPTVSIGGITLSAWNTLAPSQLSSFPSGLACLKFTNTAGNTVGFRQSGTTFNVQGSCADQQIMAFVPLDASGRFDFWLNNLSNSPVLYILGAFPSSDFVANAPVGVSTTTSFVTQNMNTVAGYPAGLAVAAVFFTPAGGDTDFRLPTSSDNFKDTNAGAAWHSAIAPLDSSTNTQVSSVAANTTYAVGYFTGSSGFNWHDPAVNVTPGTAGSNQNIAQAGTDPASGILANLYDFKVSAANHYTVQLQGGTLSIGTNPGGNRHEQELVGAPSMINMGSVSTATLYERGFFGAPVSYALHSTLEF